MGDVQSLPICGCMDDKRDKQILDTTKQERLTPGATSGQESENMGNFFDIDSDSEEVEEPLPPSKPIPETGDEKEDIKESEPSTVTRYEIFDIIEQNKNISGLPSYSRLLSALKKLMEGDNGTSIFFKLASYHGEPGPGVCTHRNESFPVWHRIYLREFEKELQKADKALGNDGNLGLPYWDWSNPKNANKGLPKIAQDLYKDTKGTWPPKFFPPGYNPGGMDLTRPSNRSVNRGIRDKHDQINDTLKEPFHWQFASSKHGWYDSLEGAHDALHGIIAGNNGVMGSVPVAAFDIMFWIHHCNVDRIYERYLDFDKDGNMKSDSRNEFEKEQQRLADENGETDLFDEPFPTYEMIEGFGKNGKIRVNPWNKQRCQRIC